MRRHWFVVVFFGLLTATCGWQVPATTPTDRLEILIQDDTVRHFGKDTLTLELILSNAGDSDLAVMPGGGAFTVWRSLDSFITDNERVYCGCGMFTLGDTLHIQAGEEIELSVAFVDCEETEHPDSAEYYVQYAVQLELGSGSKSVRSFSRDRVVIISRRPADGETEHH